MLSTDYRDINLHVTTEVYITWVLFNYTQPTFIITCHSSTPPPPPPSQNIKRNKIFVMNKQMFWQFCHIHAQNSLFITMLYTMEYSLPYDILSDDILLLSL